MLDSDEIERATGIAARAKDVTDVLDSGGDTAAALLRQILQRGLAGESLDDLPLDDKAGFILLGGAATAMRDIGRHEAEVVLWRKALAIRRWPLFNRRLSIALLRLGDLAGARAIADALQAQHPQSINQRFESHLDDLAGAEWLIETLHARPAPRQEPAPKAAVAYCLHNSPPHAAGGYAMRSHALAAAICRTGRKLIAVARPGFPSDSTSNGADVQECTQIDLVPYLFENGFGRRGRSFGYLREATDYYARVFEEQEIGIVHAATNFWTALPAGLAARRLGLPFIYEVRSFWSVTREAAEPDFRELPQAQRDDLLEQLALSLADHVLALNSAMASHLAEYGVDPVRVTIVPNCVDTERFRPGPRDPVLSERYGLTPDDIVIGYIGAMREYEGLDLLIDAVPTLASDRPNLKLLLFGADPALVSLPGSVEHGLAAGIETAGAGERIRLLPPVPPDEVPALYRLFDICAYPRRAFAVTELVPPLKPLEAMASERAVVISDVGGMRDLIEDGRTGLVCAKDDADSLAGALGRLADDPALRERLGKAASDFVALERRWRDAAATVTGVYEDLAAPAPSGSAPSLSATLTALFGTQR